MLIRRSGRNVQVGSVWHFTLALTSSLAAACGLTGCGGSTDAPAKLTPTFPGISLTIGAIGDPAILAGASLQRGEWIASRAGALEFNEKPLDIKDLSGSDVFLFPGERMGDLVDAGALAVIPRASVQVQVSVDSLDSPASASPSEDEGKPKPPAGPVESFQYNDIAPVFRDHVAKYGENLRALPYGGSALVLVYRQDAFRRDANQKAAKEAGLSLEQPPRSWKDFEALAKFFQKRDWDGDGSPDFGVSLALGDDTDRLASSTYLARAVGPGLHRDFFSFLFDTDSMTPRLQSPPFVEALASLVALRDCGPPGMEKFDAKAARDAFHAGHVAMLIDRAERVAAWSHGKPIGVAPLPGSNRVYDPFRKAWEESSTPNTPSYLPIGGGWLIGVRSGLEGTKLEAAIDFARFLADPENSNRIRSERRFAMLPFRITQMGQGLPDPTSAPDVDVRLWSEAVSRTLLTTRVIPGLRIPEAGGYLDDLTQGRAAALKGEAPEKALAAVAEAWNQRTAKLGPKRQSWHYLNSLNSQATLPEPPPRGK